MALASAIKGRTRPGQLITLQRRGGGVVDLTGAASITGKLQPKGGTGTTRNIAGALAVAGTPTAGQITWDYGAADVAEAGYFWVQLTITFGDGTSESSFIDEWKVEDAL